MLENNPFVKLKRAMIMINTMSELNQTLPSALPTKLHLKNKGMKISLATAQSSNFIGLTHFISSFCVQPRINLYKHLYIWK